jgi:hypothetical protein
MIAEFANKSLCLFRHYGIHFRQSARKEEKREGKDMVFIRLFLQAGSLYPKEKGFIYQQNG